MMIQEFIDRTGYHPTNEEYHYIEQSYYDAETCSKDVFCKQWLIDNACGKWQIELKFRMMLDEQRARYEAKLAEKDEMLDFYREQFQQKKQLEKTMKAVKAITKELTETLKS